MSINQVLAVLTSFNESKPSGPHELPARILKATAHEIAPSLCELFNKSLGSLPTDWKLPNKKFLYLRRAIKNTKTVDPSHHCTSSQKLWSAVCLMLLKDQVSRLVSSCQHSFSHGKAFVRYGTDRGDWLYWSLTVELDMGGGRGGRGGKVRWTLSI